MAALDTYNSGLVQYYVFVVTQSFFTFDMNQNIFEGPQECCVSYTLWPCLWLRDLAVWVMMVPLCFGFYLFRRYLSCSENQESCWHSRHLHRPGLGQWKHVLLMLMGRASFQGSDCRWAGGQFLVDTWAVKWLVRILALVHAGLPDKWLTHLSLAKDWNLIEYN